jgi:hypothetical protein
MADRRGAIVALIALLSLAACGKTDNDHRRPDPAAPTSIPAAAVTPSPNATAAGASLAKYASHYPFDAVDGVRFLDAPEVRSAVAALVPAADVRALVLGGEGPATPIAMRGGALVAWGCETHNCGDHDWAIAIAPDGGHAQVCYHDAAAMHGQSRWYVAPGKTEMRDGDCPSGD